jgi:hypothetical protein
VAIVDVLCARPPATAVAALIFDDCDAGDNHHSQASRRWLLCGQMKSPKTL